ncbi:hypothetical protein BKA69DRAFT_81533 [Paraphysoderma sedebokerense]|nr:hypothetical protein BKA69DRAFT_81533 [Paraphysoderma sedebokerense]
MRSLEILLLYSVISALVLISYGEPDQVNWSSRQGTKKVTQVKNGEQISSSVTKKGIAGSWQTMNESTCTEENCKGKFPKCGEALAFNVTYIGSTSKKFSRQRIKVTHGISWNA